MNLAFINWNVEPEIFPHTAIPIRWYGLFFVLAFYIAYIILTRMFKKEKIKIELLDSLTIYMLIATVIGARLGHCLFYEPDIYLKKPIEILYIWEGGLASHGAAIAILIAIWIFVRKNKEITYIWALDRVVLVTALAGFWIRMGNLMNSEIIGKATNVPWGFNFVKLEQFGVFGPHHPSQIYEALAYLAIFLFMYFHYYARNGHPKPGFYIGFFLTAVFAARFLIEFTKENQVAFENHMKFNMGQLLSIPFILIGIGFLVYSLKSKRVIGT